MISIVSQRSAWAWPLLCFANLLFFLHDGWMDAFLSYGLDEIVGFFLFRESSTVCGSLWCFLECFLLWIYYKSHVGICSMWCRWNVRSWKYQLFFTWQVFWVNWEGEGRIFYFADCFCFDPLYFALNYLLIPKQDAWKYSWWWNRPTVCVWAAMNIQSNLFLKPWLNNQCIRQVKVFSLTSPLATIFLVLWVVAQQVRTYPRTSLGLHSNQKKRAKVSLCHFLCSQVTV